MSVTPGHAETRVGLHGVSIVVEGEEQAVHYPVVAGAEVLHDLRRWPEYHERYFRTLFLDPDGVRIVVVASRGACLAPVS